MTSAHRPWLMGATACVLTGSCWLGMARAQQRSPGLELIRGGGTPAAIQGMQILNSNKCRLVVPPNNASMQPLWIEPSLVKAKNSLGCLSAADALYGPDGCPTKLCGANQGVIPLPAGAGSAAPQLPAP